MRDEMRQMMLSLQAENLLNAALRVDIDEQNALALIREIAGEIDCCRCLPDAAALI